MSMRPLLFVSVVLCLLVICAAQAQLPPSVGWSLPTVATVQSTYNCSGVSSIRASAAFPGSVYLVCTQSGILQVNTTTGMETTLIATTDCVAPTDVSEVIFSATPYLLATCGNGIFSFALPAGPLQQLAWTYGTPASLAANAATVATDARHRAALLAFFPPTGTPDAAPTVAEEYLNAGECADAAQIISVGAARNAFFVACSSGGGVLSVTVNLTAALVDYTTVISPFDCAGASALALSPAGDLYASCASAGNSGTSGNSVVRLDATGNVTAVLTATQCLNPTALVVDGATGTLYAACNAPGFSLMAATANGAQAASMLSAAICPSPSALFLAADGGMWVGCQGTGQVMVVQLMQNTLAATPLVAAVISSVAPPIPSACSSVTAVASVGSNLPMLACATSGVILDLGISNGTAISAVLATDDQCHAPTSIVGQPATYAACPNGGVLGFSISGTVSWTIPAYYCGAGIAVAEVDNNVYGVCASGVWTARIGSNHGGSHSAPTLIAPATVCNAPTAVAVSNVGVYTSCSVSGVLLWKATWDSSLECDVYAAAPILTATQCPAAAAMAVGTVTNSTVVYAGCGNGVLAVNEPSYGSGESNIAVLADATQCAGVTALAVDGSGAVWAACGTTGGVIAVNIAAGWALQMVAPADCIAPTTMSFVDAQTLFVLCSGNAAGNQVQFVTVLSTIPATTVPPATTAPGTTTSTAAPVSTIAASTTTAAGATTATTAAGGATTAATSTTAAGDATTIPVNTTAAGDTTPSTAAGGATTIAASTTTAAGPATTTAAGAATTAAPATTVAGGDTTTAGATTAAAGDTTAAPVTTTVPSAPDANVTVTGAPGANVTTTAAPSNSTLGQGDGDNDPGSSADNPNGKPASPASIAEVNTVLVSVMTVAVTAILMHWTVVLRMDA